MKAPLPARCRVVLSLLLALAGGVTWVAQPLVQAISVDQVPNPRARGEWVSDVAGVVSPEDVTRLNALLADLERDTGAEVAVVTVPDTGEETPKEFATALFNRWGIGKRGRDNGLLVLIATGTRRVEVETGYGLEPVLPDGRIGAILDRYAVPRFREGRYGEGVLAAVAQMAQVIREEYAEGGGAAAPPGTTTPAAPTAGAIGSLWGIGGVIAAALSLYWTGRGWRRGASAPDPGPRMPALFAALVAVGLSAAPLALGDPVPWGVLLGALLALGLTVFGLLEPSLPPASAAWGSAGGVLVQALYALAAAALAVPAMAGGFLSLLAYAALAGGGGAALRRVLFSRPRPCPRCGGAMRWLAERQEAPYLQDAQSLEQELGSVDYDVWRCDNCQEAEVYPRYRPWSPYDPCPRCGYRTLKTDHVTVSTPTYYRDGRERVTQHCRNCGFARRYDRRLPRRSSPPVVIGGWGGGWSGGGSGGGFGGGFGGGRSGGGGAGRSW